MLDVLSDGFIIVLPKKKILGDYSSQSYPKSFLDEYIHHSPPQKKFPLVERKKDPLKKNPFPTILQLLKGKLNQQTNKFLFFPSIF